MRPSVLVALFLVGWCWAQQQEQVVDAFLGGTEQVAKPLTPEQSAFLHRLADEVAALKMPRAQEAELMRRWRRVILREVVKQRPDLTRDERDALNQETYRDRNETYDLLQEQRPNEVFLTIARLNCGGRMSCVQESKWKWQRFFFIFSQLASSSNAKGFAVASNDPLLQRLPPTLAVLFEQKRHEGSGMVSVQPVDWRLVAREGLQVHPESRYLGMVALFGLLMVGLAGVGVVGAITTSMWKEDRSRPLLLGLGLVVAGTALAYWVLLACYGWSSAFQPDQGVTESTVQLVDRLAQLLLAWLLAVFTLMLVKPVLESFSSSPRPLFLAVALVILLLCVGVSAYAIGMLLQSRFGSSFVFDASMPLLAAVLVLLAAALFAAMLVTLCKTRRWSQLPEDARRQARRNSAIMLVFSAAVLAAMVARLVVVCVYAFQSMSNERILLALQGMSTGLVVLSVGVYLFAVWWDGRRRARKFVNKGAYEPLQEGSELSVPLQYRDF